MDCPEGSGHLIGGSGCCRGLGVGERLRGVARVGFWGLFERMHAGGRICNLVCGVGPGQGFIGGTTGCSGGMAAVQQQSTATHTDRGGRAGTQEDCDLHRWTRLDVLPPDGMQEIHAPLRGAPVGTKLGGGRPGPWVICVVWMADQLTRVGWGGQAWAGVPLVVTGSSWPVRGRMQVWCWSPMPGAPRCCCVRVCQSPVLIWAPAGGSPFPVV
jgi:hypothetical protein